MLLNKSHIVEFVNPSDCKVDSYYQSKPVCRINDFELPYGATVLYAKSIETDEVLKQSLVFDSECWSADDAQAWADQRDITYRRVIEARDQSERYVNMADRKTIIAPLWFEADKVSIKAAGGEVKKPSFTAKVNGGSVMDIPYMGRVVVDLSGAKPSKPQLPLLLQHDHTKILGYTDKHWTDDSGFYASGFFTTKSSGYARQVVELAQEDFPWQCSAHIEALSVEEVGDGVETQVNGRTEVGPLLVFRKSKFYEATICPIGADSETGIMKLAASNESAANETSEYQVDVIRQENNMKTEIEAAAETTIEAADEVQEELVELVEAPEDKSEEDEQAETESVEASAETESVEDESVEDESVEDESVEEQPEADAVETVEASAEEVVESEGEMTVEKLIASHPELIATIRSEAVLTERGRIHEIKAAAFAGQNELVDRLIDEGVSIDAARVQIIEAEKVRKGNAIEAGVREDKALGLDEIGTAHTEIVASKPTSEMNDEEIELKAQAMWEEESVRKIYFGNMKNLVAYMKAQRSRRS